MRSLVETTWEPVGCDICGCREALIPLGERRARIAQRQCDYEWRHEDAQCPRCGFVFNRLRPDGTFLRDYYADCWPIASSSVTIAPDFDTAFRLEVLSRWVTKGARLYEIGDKLGEFHGALEAAGYTVVGDDVMAEAGERSRWLEGLFRRDGETLPPSSLRESFDAVLAYFVVEHLANPGVWFRAMRECLRPGGVIVIEVPNLARHPKEALMHEHFLYLTPANLGALLATTGFEVVEVVEEGASRPFGFSLVARRSETAGVLDVGALHKLAPGLRESYARGRSLLDAATANLAATAHLAADAFAGAAAEISFWGANQTATEIAHQLAALLPSRANGFRVFDNSDVKHGTALAGFSGTVEKPEGTRFDPAKRHVCVICSRGWTEAIANQIRGLNLPHVVLIDGAAGRLLPASNGTLVSLAR